LIVVSGEGVQFMTTRVIVADGEPLFREGLAQLLATQPDLSVVGEAADSGEAIEQTRRERPDVVLLALDLPAAGGQETARRIHHISPDIKVIMLVPPRSNEEHPLLGDDVHSVLNSSARATQIFERIRTVREVGLDSEALAPVGLGLREIDDGDPHAKLTPREWEVLTLIARAWSNRQIQVALGIQNSTVKQHVRRILRKLHARNRVQAAVFAYQASTMSREGAPKP
jgi:DNA-binding NarL/FixJ family response regulator